VDLVTLEMAAGIIVALAVPAGALGVWLLCKPRGAPLHADRLIVDVSDPVRPAPDGYGGEDTGTWLAVCQQPAEPAALLALPAGPAPEPLPTRPAYAPRHAQPGPAPELARVSEPSGSAGG
jgi:hypothetical protein